MSSIRASLIPSVFAVAICLREWKTGRRAAFCRFYVLSSATDHLSFRLRLHRMIRGFALGVILSSGTEF